MKHIILSSLSVLLVSTTSAIAQETTFNSSRSVAPQVAQASNNTLAMGTFVTTEQDHPTSGMATIIEENGKRYLVFDDEFTTAEGPDVQVVLHRESTVPVNLEEEDYMTIAPLVSMNGTQRYVLPDDLNLDEFQAVSIWCRQFNVSFGYAALN
ncbi:MAG: electron transfer flavoprotein [Cyanobacteria bacterium]|jgi:hypothetical protein|nr:electron transfer flavoprotein [Cyanobacteria bacterium GSL.Bin21]